MSLKRLIIYVVWSCFAYLSRSLTLITIRFSSKLVICCIDSFYCGSILTGWGKHSKVVGDGALKRAVEVLLRGMDAPFHLSKCNMGRFTSSGSVVATWLRESATLKLLILHDHISTTRATTTMKSTDQQQREQTPLTLQPLLL